MKTCFQLVLLLTALSITCSCHTDHPKAAARSIDTVAKKNKLIPSPKTSVDSERDADIAIQQVENLPEYKNILKWYAKTNKDTSRHIAVLLEQTPDKNSKYYWIEVGEDTPDHLVSMLHFYVDPHNLSVYYPDPETDSILTMDKWRKSGKDSYLH